MEVNQENICNVQSPPNDHCGVASAPPSQSAETGGSTSTPSHTTPPTMALAPNSLTPSQLQDQQGVVEGAPVRAVDRNWARVRQKVIGNDSVAQAPISGNLEASIPDNSIVPVTSNSDTQHGSDSNHEHPMGNEMRHAVGHTADQSRVYPQMPTESLGAGVGLGAGTGTGTGPVSTGIRGVLGFRTVVVQRTQLRKMEKEIEKALHRYTNEQSQTRSRSVPKIGTAVRGARGMIPGGAYSIMTIQEPNSADKSFIDEISDILTRWKSLTVEIPYKIDILRTLARMLQVDRPDPGYRKHNSLYTEDRVFAIIQDLLRPKVLSATIPLSSKNIQVLLATIVMLLGEQNKLPKETQDRSLQLFLHELMKRIRTGDLGLGDEKTKNPSLQEHNAKIAFLHGLIGCLRLPDLETIHFLVHEMIPNYWIEPASNYPMTMDGLVRTFGQAASEFVLGVPVAYADSPKLTQSLILDLMTFLGEFVPTTCLDGSVSKITTAMLVKFILSVFSMEYLEDQQQDKLSTEFPTTPRDGQEATPRASSSADTEQELASRTPPRSPLSPNVSGENFQARSLPPHVPNLVADEKSSPVVQRARVYFNALWDNGYQDVIIDQLKAEKIVVHQPGPNERLSRLLLQLSVLHRTAFFKPMIACVASDSTQFVTDYLCILSCLEMHMSVVDLYMRDPDMICVIAMTDVGPERPRSDSRTQALKWGSCTVGQCVIVLEFIYAIKRLARSGDKYQVEVGKMFLIDLERKLGMLLVSKEKRFLVPRPMRVMLCMIFYEIRMLCKTIHRPCWLPRILDWAVNHGGPVGANIAPSGPYGISETMRLRIKHIYLGVDGLVGEQRDRYTVRLANTQAAVNTNTGNFNGSWKNVLGESKLSPMQRKRLDRMPNIGMGETVAVLSLLITVHSAIHRTEYLHILKPLWDTYCLESHPKVSTSAVFLFVKCAEVDREAVNTLISHDLKSDDPFKRLSAVERLGIIFSHRNEMLQLPYVNDPSSRGPFRTANATVQVPFVSSEVGSNRYTMDEPRWLTELKNAGNFPIDIRNRLEELRLGEKGRVEKEMIMRAQTPLMLSWTGYRDEDFENKANFGITFNIQKDKHATVLAPVLNTLNLSIINLLDDEAVGVRSAAINFLSDYIRNQPVIFVRSLFSEIVEAKKPDVQKCLISRMQLLLSASSKLPPGFAFALFNHLFGLIKWYQRNSHPGGVEMMALIIPLLADVVSSTNDIVYKDFKRNKVDVFIANMGRFWFKSNIMPESMFPSRLVDTLDILPRLGVPRQLLHMAIININQIQFMTSFLARFPSEVTDIKNSIGRFNKMPRLSSAETNVTSKLDGSQFLPDESKVKARFVASKISKDQSIQELSSLRARAWLCFIINLIQRMEKDSTDRIGLIHIFNGVNTILLEHGDDLGIVGQALEVYVTAATHLRRFFASQNGYSLIFPTLFKIYCDSTTVAIVQDTIDAAFYRFYLLHQEAFVLQSLGAIVPLMLRSMRPEQLEIMARCLYAFLEALDQPTTTSHSKALGVQSLSEPFHESSTYGGPQLEIPDWMSSFIPKDSKFFQSSNILHKREFSVSDSIKLFLAVIAFDPGSVRSEQFVRVLRHILPYFLDREPQLMTSGLDSLVDVFAKFSRSSKPLVPPSFVPPEVAPRQSQDTDDSTCDLSRFALCLDPISKSQAIKGKTWAQNDRVAIKHEFVCLIETFCDRGGQLADNQHQQMVALIRSIVKDYTSLKIPCTTEWIKDYIKNVILPVQSLQQSCSAVLYLVFQFSNTLRAHYKSIDFSGFLEGLLLIVEDDRHYLRNSPELSIMIREKIINPALSLSVKGGWATDSVYISQAKFCSSLVDLMLSMINNADTDTMAELEHAASTPRLMAYIIIPMCLRFKSRAQATSLDILEMQFWLRMLGLAIKAAEYDTTMRRSSRMAGLLAPVLNVARVSRRRTSFDIPMPMSPQVAPPTPFLPPANIVPQTPGPSKKVSLLHREDHAEDDQYHRSESTMNSSPGLLVDFIALRIIMVRGERYLSFHHGCWLDIFNIVKKYFWGHAFIASSFSGATPSGHVRQNSTSGSGPPSPNIMTPPLASPRTNMPLTPDSRQIGGGALSPFPGLFRSVSDVAPFVGPGRPQENVPTTALGYILWSFAETVVFNRLPLMIMMRPFLLDQLRMQELHPQAQSARFARSTSSSGQNSPAFYWPSPAMLPSSQSTAIPSPRISPVHQRSGSGASEGSHPRERRKQWKSWSKPEQTMNAFTIIENPLQSLTGPMSPHQHPTAPSHQRQRSFVSITEHGGNASAASRTAIHHPRGHNKHQRSESECRSEHILPKPLVDRANKSMEHVRAMMTFAPNGATAYSEFGTSMYPEKRPSSALGLSPSMARHSDRRDAFPLPSPELGQSGGDQFLLPGKYERQPVSPGFGSMFLAREAALNSTLSPSDILVQGSSPQPSLTLSVPGAAVPEPVRPTLRVVTNEANLSLRKSLNSIDESRSHTLGAPQSTHPASFGEQPTPVPTAKPQIVSKKGRSIMKPSIITTMPSKSDNGSQVQISAELPSAMGAPSPNQHQDIDPIRRLDSRTTDDGISMASGRASLDKHPAISREDREDYRVACLQARTKTFIQNIEEETRTILTCFPSVFSIGFVPVTSPPLQPAETTAAAAPADTAEEQQQSEKTPSVSRVQQNDQARLSNSSLAVPAIRTPSITIQDQSYLAPSPINPLPSALDGGEHLFQWNLKRAESLDTTDRPYKTGSLPPPPQKGAAKENQRKSVIFQRTHPMDNPHEGTSGATVTNNGGGNITTSASRPAASQTEDFSFSQTTAVPPTPSITLSSPPIISPSPPPPPLLLSPSQHGHIQDE
ncbi:hypothetical protein BGZ79_008697 [Entomortierella chlamydospora]|nr:hypothetical protein BGZ79_008697 [Entomortierella chlamydospora]